MKKLNFALVIVFFTLLLTGCGAASAISGGIQDARVYFTETVQLESGLSAQYANIMVTYSNKMSSVIEQHPLIGECFTNTDAVSNGALAGAFDDQNQDPNKASGLVNKQAFVSALSVNQSFPDVAKCQQAELDLMNTINDFRSSNLDETRKLLDQLRMYNNKLKDDALKQVLLDALKKNPDALSGLGISSDFIGFPTDSLSVTLPGGENICSYYFGLAQNDKMQMAKWNPALNTCTLSRASALEFFKRPVISAAAANTYTTGVDSGLNFNPTATAKPQ